LFSQQFIHVYTNIKSLADHHIIPIVLLLQNTKKTIGDGSKPYPPSEHQNSWDLWMFIPLKMVSIGIDP
jgi:hypothetical protein